MSKIKLVIDREKCVQCGQCINDCICSVLEFDENNIPKIAKDGEKRCIKCQHCLAVCPTGALSIFGKNAEDSLAISNKNISDDLLNLIQSRRSIRQFKKENLSNECLDKIKNMLAWIPTGCNNHKLMFHFIDDIEAMKHFKNKTFEYLKKIYQKGNITEEQKKLLLFKQEVLNDKDIIFRDAPHLVLVSSPKNAPCADIDPVIALSYLELYANSLGAGTLWCGFATYCIQEIPELQKELKVPEDYKPVYCMLLGPANIKYKRITQPEKYKIVTYNKLVAKFDNFIQGIKDILSGIFN